MYGTYNVVIYRSWDIKARLVIRHFYTQMKVILGRYLCTWLISCLVHLLVLLMIRLLEVVSKLCIIIEEGIISGIKFSVFTS